MAQLATSAGMKLFKQEAQKRGKKEDPYFEEYQGKTWYGRPTTKKRKKAAPSTLSPNDQKVYKKVRKMAKTLDEGLCNCCGVRIGWSAVIGLAPGVGDIADVILALNVLRNCEKIDGGLPSSTRTRMQLNIAADFAIGLVPIAGDIADAFYKCNTRNLLLLEKVLQKRAAEALAKMETHGELPPSMSQPSAGEAVAHGGLIPATTDQFGHGREHGHGHGRGRGDGYAPNCRENATASRETSRSRRGQAPVREYSAIGHGGDGGAGMSREDRRYHQGDHHHRGRPENGVGFS